MKKETPTSRTQALAPEQKFCPLCNTPMLRTAFYGSPLSSDGLMPFCGLHLSSSQAEHREAYACNELRRVGIHPHSPLTSILV